MKKAKSGTVENGSKVINLVESDDMSGISTGALVSVGRYIAPALGGTIDTIILLEDWPYPTESGPVYVFNSIEQLATISAQVTEASSRLTAMTDKFSAVLTSEEPKVDIPLTAEVSQEVVPYGYLSNQLSAQIASITGLQDSIATLISKVDSLEDNKLLIGDGSPGSRRLNVFTSFIPSGKDLVPEGEQPPGWEATNENLFIHLKTGLNTQTDSKDFHYTISVYGYTGGVIAQEVVTGYSSPTENNVINVSIQTTLDTIVYRAPNGDVYIRIPAVNLYYWNLIIDGTNVSGFLPDEGSVSLVVSPNPMLNSYT